ncbi:hypothetical protein AN926_05810 [Thermus scotoductus]|uniref:Uncharacterized protein n=1 Tax=Thermus scotoductus TaxID=37636 RepID=A0A0N0IQW5_THESC|nr:hypothetical protein AN926_05810 [Thermus scotoductus]
MGRRIPGSLHLVVSPVHPFPHHQDRPHRHLPLLEGLPGLLEGQGHVPLLLGRGIKAQDLHHPLTLRPHRPKGLELLRHPFLRQKVHQALSPVGHGQVVPRQGAAEPGGKGQPGLGGKEEKGTSLAPGRVAAGQGGHLAP